MLCCADKNVTIRSFRPLICCDHSHQFVFKLVIVPSFHLVCFVMTFCNRPLIGGDWREENIKRDASHFLTDPFNCICTTLSVLRLLLNLGTYVQHVTASLIFKCLHLETSNS